MTSKYESFVGIVLGVVDVVLTAISSFLRLLVDQRL